MALTAQDAHITPTRDVIRFTTDAPLSAMQMDGAEYGAAANALTRDIIPLMSFDLGSSSLEEEASLAAERQDLALEMTS